MADKKLNEVLDDVLDSPVDEATIAVGVEGVPQYDVEQEAEMRSKHDRLSPAYSFMPTSDEQEEPMDKIMVAIQHHLINGDYEAASDLVQKYRTGRKKGTFFSAHHMNQLIDWVRNIHKYTNTTDLNQNYYNNQLKQEIEGAKDLKRIKVKEDLVDKLMTDVEKTLRRKLEMR